MEQIENQEIIEEKNDHIIRVSPHSPSIQAQSQSQPIDKKTFNMFINEANLSKKYLGKSQDERAKKDQAPLMTKQEYEVKCIEIKKRIIFGNVPNGLTNYKKPQIYYKVNTKENSAQEESFRQKKKTEKKNMIYLLKGHGDVKVDFISPQSSAPSQFSRRIKNQPHKVEQTDKSHIDHKNNKQIKEEQDQNQNNKVSIYQLKQKNLLKVSSFRNFLYMQLLPNYQIFVEVKCTKKGLFNSTYKFYFQETKKFIMACEKQGFTKYVFSSSQSRIDQSHISHLGSMDTNFAGSQFFIYDSGEDCDKSKFRESIKKQLAFVHYFQEYNQPITLSTLITTDDNQSGDFTVSDKKDNVLNNQWAMGHRDGLCKLSSQLSADNSHDCSDKLDFRGLSGATSTKNFTVQNPNYPEALIFGRQSKETYLMRVKAPFSLIQAFAICMSSIHYKFV